MKTKIYVIKNVFAGTYIHKDIMNILGFKSKSQAENYIANRNLNPDYYKLMEIKQDE